MILYEKIHCLLEAASSKIFSTWSIGTCFPKYYLSYSGNAIGNDSSPVHRGEWIHSRKIQKQRRYGSPKDGSCSLSLRTVMPIRAWIGILYKNTHLPPPPTTFLLRAPHGGGGAGEGSVSFEIAAKVTLIYPLRENCLGLVGLRLPFFTNPNLFF